MRPFCRSGPDTNCFIPLNLLAVETPSHGLRQFPELQIPYVVEYAPLFDLLRGGEDWHSPCTNSLMRKRETRYAFGGARRQEGLMK